MYFYFVSTDQRAGDEFCKIPKISPGQVKNQRHIQKGIVTEKGGLLLERNLCSVTFGSHQ